MSYSDSLQRALPKYHTVWKSTQSLTLASEAIRQHSKYSFRLWCLKMRILWKCSNTVMIAKVSFCLFFLVTDANGCSRASDRTRDTYPHSHLFAVVTCLHTILWGLLVYYHSQKGNSYHAWLFPRKALLPEVCSSILIQLCNIARLRLDGQPKVLFSHTSRIFFQTFQGWETTKRW